jgi:quinol monooxygenase YgiN
MTQPFPVPKASAPAAALGTHLIRIVRMHFRPDEVARFRQLFDGVKDRIRSFAGCRDLYLLRDDALPEVYYTYSVWEDGAALDAYRNSALFRHTWKETRALFAAPAQAYSLQEVEHIVPMSATCPPEEH